MSDNANYATLDVEQSSERFWSKVLKTDSCWMWTGAQNTQGYGHFVADGRHLLAHRYAFGMHKGRPVTHHVLHKCNTPLCVNPEHLYEGTHADNSRDRSAAGHTRVCYRDAKPLCAQEMSLIVAANVLGISQQKIARLLGRNVMTINRYLTGKSHGELP